MTTTQPTFQPLIKSCETCAHFRPHENRMASHKCARFQTFTNIAITYDCGRKLSEWTPMPPKPSEPPRRSLRRWVHDTFFAP